MHTMSSMSMQQTRWKIGSTKMRACNYNPVTKTTLVEQRKFLLAAVKVLTNNGKHSLAQQLWDASSQFDRRHQRSLTGVSD